jgi:hypothetical protein
MGDEEKCSDSADRVICFSSACHCFSSIRNLDREEFAIMSKEEDNAVFQDATNEDVRLENLGYEQGEFEWGTIGPASRLTLLQELKRSFGLLSMIGFSFSVVTS